MRSLVAFSALFAILACRPLVMLPGGELSGSLKAPPGDWAFSNSIKTVQLETRPKAPYSVNIWGVGVGEWFYVAAGNAESRWARNIAENPQVRLKLGESLYELRAVRTEAPAELDAFLAAVKRKYDFEPDPDQRASAALFRLEPRGPSSQ
jgi:hypothetical protein